MTGWMLPAIRQGGIHANQSQSGSLSVRRFRGGRRTHDSKMELLPENCSTIVGMRKIVEWFNSWTVWQKRLLLCGITERCSKSQLELLISTLEPVFHRDFVATLSHRYPSAGIRQMYERREAKRLAAMMDSDTELDGSGPEASGVSFSGEASGPEPELAALSSHSIAAADESFVEQLTREIVDNALREIHELEMARRVDSMTPDERHDISALTPSVVFSPFTPVPTFSPDPGGRRMGGHPGSLFRPSVDQLAHKHNTSLPSRLNTADFHHFEGRSGAPTARPSVSIARVPAAGGEKKSSKLRRVFAAQLNSIWKLLANWPPQEKVRVTAELVQLCDKPEVHYLAQCLIHRLKDHGNVNSLPDKLLYKIFRLLPISDLSAVAQVCRRWHYVASRDELWMYKSYELGRQIGVPNVVSLVKRKFRANAANIDWKIAYRELRDIGRQAQDAIPLPDLLQEDQDSAQQAHQGKRSSRRQGRRMGSRAMSIISSLSRSSSFYTAYRHQVSRKSTRSRSGRSSRASSAASEMEDYVDRRPLMKPILGKLKRFQDSEDVAIDVRPQLKQMNDLLGLSEAKETLCWKHDLDITGQRGVFVTEVPPVQRCRRLQGHLDAILCLQHDDRRLITGSMDRSVRIWDVRSGRSIRKLYGHKGGVCCLHFTGNQLITGSWDMSAMVWSLEPTFELRVMLSGHSNTVTSVKLAGRHVVSASFDGTVRIYNSLSFFLANVVDLKQPIQCMHCDGTQLITSHTDRKIRISTFPSGMVRSVLRGHSDQILTLVVSGRLLISGGHLGYVRFWDIREGSCEAGVDAQPSGVSDRVGVTCLAFYRGNFWTGHQDGSVREWNLITMTCVRTLVGHKGPVRGLQISQRRVVSASDDGSSRIWEFVRPQAAGGAKESRHRQTGGGELLKPKVLLQPRKPPTRQ